MTQRHPVQNDEPMLITSVAKHRAHIFRDDTNAREAVESLYRTQEQHPFFLYAFVIMPNHVHLLLQVPSPESISRIMNVYKGTASASIGRGPLWQSRFHIRYVDNLSTAKSYIHNNPIVKGLCERPEDYPWSSACGAWDVTPILW